MQWRRGRDLNPRGDTPTGLAGRRPTRLGDPGTHHACRDFINWQGLKLFRGEGSWRTLRRYGLHASLYVK